MTAIAKPIPRTTNDSLRMVAALVRREIIDTLRDWRIVVPIIILTSFFPALMSFVADLAMRWVAKYNNPIIAEQLIPFLLLIVGFFPISFSLVIALETFVGEKERNSLEPLLATPLTDSQLYLAKMLAAMIPPLLASYLGIGVYLAGMYFTKGWTPSPILLALVLLLTTTEGIVMVSGAVVISSQTTSVRASNLLASFIIIPAALLLQVEAMIMFYNNYDALWWIALFLIVVDVILVRMGIHIFNREELLGREIDELNIPSLWRTFCGHLRGKRWFFGRDVEQFPVGLRWLGTLGGLYRHDVPAILRRSRFALVMVLVGLLLAVWVGFSFADRFPLPPDALELDNITAETFDDAPRIDWLPAFTVRGILGNNIRALLLASLLAVFSFGTLAEALLILPMAIIFFFVGQAAQMGYDPILFFSAFVLPHGLFELPAAIVATAMAVRLGATFMSPPQGMTIGEGWLYALADLGKVFVAFVVPLLALAAAVEVYITPAIVVWAFGS